MARRLLNIIQSPVDLKEGDKIFFTFKKHKFSANITNAGLIHNVLWEAPGKVGIQIFRTRTFESLTDWTETCIQEKLDEYHTRYSAWRRVRHLKSNKPMETLYKDYQRMKLNSGKMNKLTTQEMQQLISLNAERILYLEKCIEARDETVDKWVKWFKDTHPGEKIPIALNEPVEQEKVETEPRAPLTATEIVQPIVLNSPSGAYMVIQRLKETNPNAIQAVQTLGLNGFRDMTKKFSESHKTWYPPSNEPWFNKAVHEINSNPRVIAQMVHEFFTKK
tara:strand:+ start:332 stop:1162 length:831 start_codon:yes stop_codon:yes gene_type:complete